MRIYADTGKLLIMARSGRPSSYTPEMAERICAALATGKLMRQVCASPGMPGVSTVFEWLAAIPPFAEMYTHAKELQADAIAADTLKIADTIREGTKTEEKQVAWACSKCGADVKWRGKLWVHSLAASPICMEAKAEKIFESKTQTGDMVDRARLMVDTRKWLLSKMLPRKYGDRLELAGDKDNPLHIIQTAAETLRGRFKRRTGEES